jgi:NAD(P)-dependent dehydrogenase (short-subunit alcohol dehydrogenase family)
VRVLITGSTQGLGLLTGQLLAAEGHTVVLHARSRARAAALPPAISSVVGDVSTLEGMRSIAEQANAMAPFDTVVHNVAIGYQEQRRVETADGLSQLWAVNVLAPYVLTALLHRPARLVYLSSGMHHGGDTSLRDPQWVARPWRGPSAYSDSKLHDLLLAFAVARRWTDVPTNAVDPGWVPTRMGGPSAPDDLDEGYRTQAWLAVSEDPEAGMTGEYVRHREPVEPAAAALDVDLQERLVDYCREISGIALDPA